MDWCRRNMVLDCDLLAHLAGNLLSHRGANLASHLVALLHWGDHCCLHWHRDALLDTPCVAHILDHHISDGGAGGPWDGVADSPGDLPCRQVAHWLRHSHALLGGGALGHCHALGHIEALGDGDAVGNGNAVGHGDTLGDAGALGDNDTVRDSNASGDGGALGHGDADGSLNGAGSLDGDAPALPPRDWLADRGDVVSNGNRCSKRNRSNRNRSNCVAESNGSNSVAEGNRSNGMAEGNWANSGSNWGNGAEGSNSVSCRGGSVVSRGEPSKELGISFSISIGFSIGLGLTLPVGSSNGTKEWASSRVSQNVGGSNMGFCAHLLNHIDALLGVGGVDDRGDLGGALLLLHANLLLVALLGARALLLSHTLGLVMALLVLGALLLSGALLLGRALLFLGALLLHVALLNRGALLLWHLSALLLLDRVHDVAALLLGVGRALLPGNLPGHRLALLHGPAAALLLVLRLVVGHTPRGADGLRDCGAGGAGDCVEDGVALWRHGDCVVRHSNCRGVVSNSNVSVTVGMPSPAMVAVGVVSIPGVGFR